MLYNRFLSADTPENSRRARGIMLGVYSLLVALGSWFLITATVGVEHIGYKTAVQALIMLLLGSGGIWISLRHREQASSDS
jgi:hypothetical protein